MGRTAFRIGLVILASWIIYGYLPDKQVEALKCYVSKEHENGNRITIERCGGGESMGYCRKAFSSNGTLLAQSCSNLDEGNCVNKIFHAHGGCFYGTVENVDRVDECMTSYFSLYWVCCGKYGFESNSKYCYCKGNLCNYAMLGGRGGVGEGGLHVTEIDLGLRRSDDGGFIVNLWIVIGIIALLGVYAVFLLFFCFVFSKIAEIFQ